MDEYVVVLTSTDSEEEARRIATHLVDRRLVACAKVAGPMLSSYWWHDKVETASEWQCWAKTRRDRYEQTERAIREMHSYEVPEILALPVLAGSTPYLRWIDDSVGGG